MRYRTPVLLAALFFVGSVFLYRVDTKALLRPLSPQATVDPANITESFNSQVRTAVFDNQETSVPLSLASSYAAKERQGKRVLGETAGEKRIEVDLTNQRVYAYEGDRRVYTFVVSTGKWGKTPTGTFRIWIKLRSTTMEGGSKELGTYYYLPNVPYVMYFYNDEIPKYRGFGLHGTYWHNNFGTPMSHGCVNLRTEDAEKLYYWAAPDLGGKSSIYASAENPGTPVIIYGTAPQS